MLFREGETATTSSWSWPGMVAVVAGYGSPEQRLIAVHGPGRFLGELGLLTGQAAFFTAVVREPGEVLGVAGRAPARLVAQRLRRSAT